MLQIKQTNEYDLWLDQLARPFVFSSPFNDKDFALLLIVADPDISMDEQNSVSEEMVRQGCRYAVCTGYQCSQWDDSIDFAYLGSDPDFSPSDVRFVMTTSHEEEPLEDVVDFFRLCTTFDNFTPHHFFVLILGGDEKMAQAVSTLLKQNFVP